MRASDGTKDLLWLTRLERGIWTAKSCDLTEIIPCTRLCNHEVNKWQRKFALFPPKQSGGTITHRKSESVRAPIVC